MVTTRVRVVSDSHLSARTPEAVANWDAVVDDIASDPPNLVVHTGDVTLDGMSYRDDLRVARDQLRRLTSRAAVIPGNHDVGDNPHAGNTQEVDRPRRRGTPLVTAERLAGYRAELGPDRWMISVPGWRLVGLNTQLFGSGLGDEAGQWRWLTSVLRPATTVPATTSLALFIHKPLLPPPGRPDKAPGRYVPTVMSGRLLAMLDAWPTCVVVSGHVHQFRCHCDAVHDNVTHLWVPSTWAALPDRFQTRLGDKVCGVVELRLGDGGDHRAELRRPPGIAQLTLVDDIPDPYPHRTRLSPE